VVEQPRKWGVHLTKKLLGQLRKKEITQNTKIQNQSARVECSSWSFKKTEEKGFPGFNSAWHSIRFGHWPSCSFRWQFDWRRWGTRRWLSVRYWSFHLRPQRRTVDTTYLIFKMGANTLCWY
jgi:hypothetical protein